MRIGHPMIFRIRRLWPLPCRDSVGYFWTKAYFLEGDRTSGVELPFPSNLAADVPFTLRIVGSDPDDYLEGEVVYVNPRTQQFGTVVAGWTLWLRQGVTVHGSTFPVGDDLRLSIVGRGQEEPIATPAKRVWARLSERGADLGLVIGDSATGEGAQERISALIRYDPSLAIVTEFTDDLERRWFALVHQHGI